MQVTKIFTFDTGHRLSNYEGKCKRLHGHTYKCEVTVGADQLDSRGMVIDFGDLKKLFEREVDERFDHRTLLYIKDDLNHRIKEALGEDRDDIVFTAYNPTAENIARNIYRLLESGLPGERGLHIVRVKLYETPTSFAEVTNRTIKIKV